MVPYQCPCRLLCFTVSVRHGCPTLARLCLARPGALRGAGAASAAAPAPALGPAATGACAAAAVLWYWMWGETHWR